jgi:hypothetical protein
LTVKFQHYNRTGQKDASYGYDWSFQDDVRDYGSHQSDGSYQNEGFYQDGISYRDDVPYQDDISYDNEGSGHENTNKLDDESVHVGESLHGIPEGVVHHSARRRGDIRTHFAKKNDDGGYSVREEIEQSKWKRHTPLTTIRENA